MMNRVFLRNGCLSLWVLALAACSSLVSPSNVKSNARLTPTTDFSRDLTQLPEPMTKIPVAVYGLRDQTGQYRSSPDSPYSTEVTQGAATMLVDALRDSGWYIPVEREGLQNLLTERRIVRAIESPGDKSRQLVNLPNLLPASLIIEGGITGYDSNVRTGGKGANFLGIGASTQYRVDQVTVELRSVDIRTGQVLNSVSVTKTIYSYQFDANVYKFTSYKNLLQGETGYTTNEPAQLAVREAIEAAVINLTIQGVRDHVLELKYAWDWNSPLVQSYLRADQANARGEKPDEDEIIPLPPPSRESARLKVRPIAMGEAMAMESPPMMETQSSSTGTSPTPVAVVASQPEESPLMRETQRSSTGTLPAPVPVVAPQPEPAQAHAAESAPPSNPAGVNTPTPAAGESAKEASTVDKPSSTGDIFNMYWQKK